MTRNHPSIPKSSLDLTSEYHGFLAVRRTVEKKLYSFRPRPEPPREARSSGARLKRVAADPLSVERGVRQALADKVSGNLLGVWLLVPELLRLGVWDLLRAWTGRATSHVEPRLALQLVYEAALCVTGVRARRCTTQRGLELASGLHFLASDVAIHDLLAPRTVDQARVLQVALGKLRLASGHFQGRVLAVDPHRVRSHSKRQMPRRRDGKDHPAIKTAQTFFALDADTGQPLAFTTGTAARSASDAAEDLLALVAAVLGPRGHNTLVLVDTEHFTAQLLDHVRERTGFDLLVPLRTQRSLVREYRTIPAESFQPRWAGYATLKRPYTPQHSARGPFYQYLQRSGETPSDYYFKAFLSTRDGDEVSDLTEQFPKRWHVEEFFNAEQALGWDRAGTMNLNIRYGHMTMALIAQAAIHQLRKRLGAPESKWDAAHLAKALFAGLEGDVRVVDGRKVQVTYYNAPDAERLRKHYEGLPERLKAEGVDPRVPWLYDFPLDFRFR